MTALLGLLLVTMAGVADAGRVEIDFELSAIPGEFTLSVDSLDGATPLAGDIRLIAFRSQPMAGLTVQLLGTATGLLSSDLRLARFSDVAFTTPLGGLRSSFSLVFLPALATGPVDLFQLMGSSLNPIGREVARRAIPEPPIVLLLTMTLLAIFASAPFVSAKRVWPTSP